MKNIKPKKDREFLIGGKRFNPDYKGWQRRTAQDRRSQEARKNSV
ncbi:MAG: hypothetical protein ACYSWS_06265 [Planctomycetota bacterium]